MHKTKVASNKSTINHALHIHHISTKVTKANDQAQAELDLSTSETQKEDGKRGVASQVSAVVLHQ